MSVLVLSGPDAALRDYCRRRFEDSDRDLPVTDLPIAAEDGFAAPFSAIRRILPRLRRQRGEGAVEAALDRHPVASSLLLPARSERLAPADIRARRRLVARRESHMTHNDLVHQPLFRQVAGLLQDLLGDPETEGRRRLVIANIAGLDGPSLRVIEAFFRSFPGTAMDLVLGHDPTVRPTQDRRGIQWSYPQLTLKTLVYGFHGLPGFAALEVPEGGATGAAPPAAERAVDPADDDLEWRVWRALRGTADPLPPEVFELAVQAVDHCFEVFAFRELLTLGLALLDRQPELEPAKEARLRSLVALAAHNRQFLSRGNQRLAELLETQVRAALALERDPLHRLALFYRLTVTLGRRQGRIEEALEVTERALAEHAAADLAAEHSTMQEAWLHNIRAFLFMRARDLDRAFAEEERALELLERCEEESEIQRQEARLSRAVVADHLSELAILARDPARRERWHRVTERLVEGWTGVEHLTSRMWMNFHRSGLRLREALEHAKAGLEASRRHHDYLLEYFHLVYLGDLYDRLGDARRALACYQEATAFRDLLGEDFEVHLPIEVARATAAARLGDPARAIRELEPLLADRAEAAGRAEILAGCGAFAAQAGDAGTAEERLNQAIDLAVESGARDTLLRVAVAAGRTALALGKPDEAAAAFRQALEIAGAGDPDEPPPAFDRADLLLGLHACGEATGEHLRAAVAVFPDALAEDVEAWWRLGELLDWIGRTGEPTVEGPAGDPGLEPALETLRRAAEQREDCRGRLVLPALEPTAAAAGSAGAP